MTTRAQVRFLDRTTPPHIVTLILLAGVGALNMSIFLPSLNAMTEYFDTSYAVMQISLSGYLAVTAVLQVFVGPISDKVGRRNVTLIAIGIFIVASFGAMFATSIEVFLGFRMLQAAVATCLVLSRTIVRDMVPQDQAASMIGYVTMGMALVPMFGPMIGGVFQQFFGWQTTFAFLTISGAMVWVLCFLDLGETVQDGGMGFGEQLKSYPDLFASPRFWGYALCTAFASGAFFALLGGASFIAGAVFNLSPFWSGVGLGAPAIGYAAGNFLSGRYSVKLGINRMALIGTIVTVAGMGASLLLALAGIHHPLIFFGFCTFLGLGNGITMPNATAGLLSVRPRLAGTASGLGGAIMVGGGAGLSQLAGGLLTVETGTVPLQWLMLIVSVLAMVSLLLVMQRTKQINA
ncbi:DHA1 family bicyclomycin/chloramphenicol resistance-like MFS transporter [Loktanella ponticola]|uniref:DHA1 family bicyclomycin/chloramphenicol resistance-like MFS transporter n=1 Tax=Yoonia ponticola TaxID=1524255 RepID=A0A7W9BI46_9RHOB|nr:multidrug effflux MFS transporter [Yoonia ponticola]MBB5720861.1 DHA1 family bicyclomycin/chloramphenicol resistance-like MFS transporter [Yoonia ponticola]